MAENKPTPTVERDENGVPTAWLLVRAGPIPLRKNGADYVLELTSKDLSAIEAYQKSQGERIPIDSNHYLHILAQKHGIEEREALQIMPSGVAAMGFGSLECRADGTELWLSGVEWTPSAYELLKEKIFRYFSPVFRGLKDGPLRITSVAMENEPAIKNLDALAAGASTCTNAVATLREATPEDAACGAYLKLETTNPNTKGRAMNMTPKLWDALMRLAPGIDAAALAAEDADETKQDELAAAVDGAASLLDDLKKLLDLAEAAGNAEIKAAVEAMLEKAKQGEAAKAEADELKLSAEQRERAEIYAKAEAERKLTPAMKPWADSLDVAALAAWYKVAPAAVRSAFGQGQNVDEAFLEDRQRVAGGGRDQDAGEHPRVNPSPGTHRLQEKAQELPETGRGRLLTRRAVRLRHVSAGCGGPGCGCLVHGGRG